ncbi:Graves disease carrier protein [Nymphon striatum]|nr:Graves disease carrier protein [Nymphon striatum]
MSKMKAYVEEGKVQFVVKSFIAGGVAGMCAKTVVAPLDRVKILLQAQSKHYRHLGVVSGIVGIVKKESVLGLYKGNKTQMVRIFPYAAIQFMTFENSQKIFQGFLGEKSRMATFMAGSLAGVTAATATYPLDVVRARFAFQVTGEHMYSGIFNTLSTMFKKEGGIRGLYRGFSPTFIGMIPYAGLSFYCFDWLKKLLLSKFPQTFGKKSSSSGGIILIVPAKILCGAFAGAIAQTAGYPFDVARRKMQLSMFPGMNKFSKNFVTTIYIVFKEHGIVKGLYRGMSINFIRVVPMASVSFCTYEMMKQFFNLDTGIST